MKSRAQEIMDPRTPSCVWADRPVVETLWVLFSPPRPIQRFQSLIDLITRHLDRPTSPP
jgi:hypothetical protein